MTNELIIGDLSLLPPLRKKTNTDVISQHDNAVLSSNPALAYLASLSSNRSDKTMRSLLNIIAKLIGYKDLYECEWGKLRRHHIQGILKILSDSERAPATINTYLAALKGTALEAWMMKQIDTENFQHIKHIKPIRGSRLSRGRALSRIEIKNLLKTCEADNSSKGVRDAAIFSVLLGCGLRRSEIVALDHKDILWQEHALRVLGKGNKERLAFMPDGTMDRLQILVEEVRGDLAGPLFTRIRRHDDITTERMTDQAIYHILQTRREESGIAKFSPHDLRRTFATTMLENGEDIITVKDAMGHANIVTTQKYDKRGDERLRKASKRFDF
jgi:integrase/recombinase XerD